MKSLLFLCMLLIPLMLKVFIYIYVFILAIVTTASAMAYQWIYINYFNKIFNHSYSNPLQVLKRPRNIKALWKLEKIDQLNDPVVGKWTRIFIYTRRAMIAMGVPFLLLLTIFGIILFTYKGAP